MTQSKTAFIDEFGNNSFEFETQGSHFIVAAVIPKGDVGVLKAGIEGIKKKHNFQSGELKSSRVGPNYGRRKRILEDISQLSISVYAVIVDKRRLYGEGFRHKKSFYKFLNNLVYKELFRTYPNLDIYVDEHGGKEFVWEFKKYVETRHIGTLFSGGSFSVQNSKLNDCIQLADFIAGSLGYIYDELKKSDNSQEFQKILSPIIASLNFFPKELSFAEFQQANIDDSFDARIAEVSFLRIQAFLEKERGEDQQKVDQINFLKLLLSLQRADPRNRFISTR